ncbi:MAG: M23 family metallopeptidase [Flavobacterium sp.]|nr:M23 family metallopeptidase [Flavobacterium sp.]
MVVLAKMSIIEQLTYVEYYLEPFKGKLNTLADFYLAILMPVDCGRGSERNHVVFDKDLILDYDSNGKSNKKTQKWVRQRAYSQNPVFFKEGNNENGKTYVWEIAEEIENWYKRGENEQHICEQNCPFKDNSVIISNSKWKDPIDNPEITLFNYYGDYKPEGSSFGLVRNGGTRYHQGLDIFAPKGTPVKSCLKGKVVSV